MTTAVRAGALVAAALLLLVGCGDDDPQAGSGATATTSSSAPASDTPSSASSSASSSDTPASEPSAGASTEAAAVAPATGERVQADSFSFTVPEGFTSSGSSSGGLAGAATYTDLTTTFCLIDASEITDIAGTLDLEGAAALQLGSNPDLTRLPDREVGGEQVFVFTSTGPSGTEHLFGRLAGDRVAELSFTFAPESVSGTPDDPAADQALVESVLATVEWKA